MKTDIVITYEKEECQEMMVAQHIIRFGSAPGGYHWEASDYYGHWKLEAVKNDEPAVEQKEELKI
jgi:hypothetical protein